MCRACEKQVHPRSRFRLCWGHAWLFALGPWATVEEFILRGSNQTRPRADNVTQEERT